ncbi:transposase [Streptomyces sp. NPDC059862]|uniref:transposase n=1 Tax=unclassified Streptomyces TaxID=2593676 RepID=UPI00362573EB
MQPGELIRPVVTAWKARQPSVCGHAGQYEMRETVNAIRCQARTDRQWRFLPHDLPLTSRPHTEAGCTRRSR